MRRAISIAAALAASATLAVGATASAAGKPAGTMITTRPGPFGNMLVVGSGKYAGYTIYLFTGDQPSKYACTATIIKTLPAGPGSCTGPAGLRTAEWPAVTTTDAPIAGPGINKALLGSVQRKGIGDQVTYDGHPLYLFDSGPGQVTGEGWDEPTLPPWHGLWWLVSPSGSPLGWPGTLDATAIGGKSVLAASMLTGIGWEDFPVYSYSGGSCTGACAVAWPPMLTDGTPALVGPLSASSVGTVKRSDGTEQVTYKGKALYLFAYEGIAPRGMGYVATGSGNGAKVGEGAFNLVAP